MESVNLIALSIPVFFALIGVELVVARLQGRKLYRLNDSLNDLACGILQWVLPRLGLRWQGFRKVRSQVCKRLAHRCRQLGLDGLDAYRGHLSDHPEELAFVDGACRITISHFYRDRLVFENLGHTVLPAVAAAALERGVPQVREWSAGCASGEEPYSVALVWRHVCAPRLPGLELRVTATDAEEHMLEWARRAVYRASSLRELPAAWIDDAFERDPDDAESFRFRSHLRREIDFRCQDVRREMPAGAFDVVLCRNLVFTYYEAEQQRELLRKMSGKLVAGGALLVGSHEALPAGVAGLAPWPGCPSVFRKSA